MANTLKFLHEEIRQECLNLFNYRCIRCQRYTETVHEIIPRSHGIKAYVLENSVPLCNACHDWAHRIGTLRSAVILNSLRKERLTRCQDEK